MSWTRGYLQGSYKGVSFYTQRASMSGGRRLVEHIFPERDDSVFEDLGRANHSFSFSCYVLGDNYFADREDFISALDSPDPGLLVHPYRGNFLVVVRDWSCVEDLSEGRVARFDVVFEQYKELLITVVKSSALDGLRDAKSSFLGAVSEALVKVYSVVTRPAQILQDVINTGNQILDIAAQAKKITGAYDEFRSRVDALRGQMQELMLTAQAIGDDLKDIIDFGTDPYDVAVSGITVGDAAKSQYSELRQVTDIQDQTLTQYPTLASGEDSYPGMELQKFASRIALGSKAGLVGTMALDNTDQAVEVADEIGRLVQTIEYQVGVDDALFLAARDLRYAVMEVLRYRKLSLDNVQEMELVEFEPALVLSYTQYGDIGRDDEIAGLNRVLHPGFVPSGTLRVQVSDG